MKGLASEIHNRLRSECVNAVAIGKAVRNDLASRGFSDPGGLYVSGVEDRTLAAMDKIYQVSFSALEDHCALNNAPASEFAPELISFLDETLGNLAHSTAADLGGPKSPSGYAVGSKARQLLRAAKDQLTGAGHFTKADTLPGSD